jgi:hypothetical protein
MPSKKLSRKSTGIRHTPSTGQPARRIDVTSSALTLYSSLTTCYYRILMPIQHAIWQVGKSLARDPNMIKNRTTRLSKLSVTDQS